MSPLQLLKIGDRLYTSRPQPITLLGRHRNEQDPVPLAEVNIDQFVPNILMSIDK
ncbi:predicted protein [Botrytis cinerea T4]|uniref:Uncharacterized protein n=1 Tax=Botryotinia fuckeliana (strain T4) TaxID=999810 RepID=G2YUN6_BOTF4|nr:predicted protein [Botrytis cinerea T4]